MVESGLESMVNHKKKDFDVNECSNCGSPIIERLTSKYAVHYMCHNPDCSEIVFDSYSRR